MSEKFGARLRQQREAQSISLDTVARQTKIKYTLLEAMEHDDVSAWPGGLFRRAFVRAYAQAVGLEPERAVREFLADFPDRVVRDPWTGSTGAEPANRAKDDAVSAATPAIRRDPIVASPVVNGPIEDIPDLDPPDFRPAEASEVVDAPEMTAAVAIPQTETETEPSLEASPTPIGLDLEAVACLCTDLGRVEHPDEVEPLVDRFARIIEAKGVIVWVWDEPADALRPAVVHGYPDHVLARLPAVTRDADNPTAEVFRTARACTISGRGEAASALVVPMLAPAGCIGALGIEFERGAEPTSSASAVATIVAAFFSQWVGGRTVSDVGEQISSRESA